MLVLVPAAPEQSSFWAPGAAFAIRRADAEIGRINLSGSPKRDGDARIRLGDRGFDCRIHENASASSRRPACGWIILSNGSLRL
jgi:hypothetical protein